MSLTIDAEYRPETTQIPNWFIRTYMPAANGNFVKLYIFLWMACQHPDTSGTLSINILADRMECTENDVIRALRYWSREGLLRFREKDDEIHDIVLTSPSAALEASAVTVNKEVPLPIKEPGVQQTPSSVPVTANEQMADKHPVPDKQTYTPLQAEALMKDVAIEQTMTAVEQLLGTPLSTSHLQLILYFMCDIGFSKDLVLAMYQTALQKGKNSPRYIEAIGISWAKQGIQTVEEATKEASHFSGRYSLVARALGIQRTLSPAECDIIHDWDKYHFADAIIEEACKRTVLQTGGTSFKYVSGILAQWAKKNVISLSDIEQCDEAFKKSKKSSASKNTVHTKNQFQNFPQRSYSQEDYISLEKQLLRS